MEQIRTFIAIELPVGVKAELDSLEKRLKRGRHPFVKWVDPDSIHLTLKFLGNIVPTAVPQIVEAINSSAKRVPPIQLRIVGLGAFPNLKRPQVVWVGIGEEVEKLATLQNIIDATLSPLGFKPDSRSFSPHLTLARLRDRVTTDERKNFAEWVSSVRFEADLSFKVSDIKLIRSQLTQGGAIYSQLATIGLGGEFSHT